MLSLLSSAPVGTPSPGRPSPRVTPPSGDGGRHSDSSSFSSSASNSPDELPSPRPSHGQHLQHHQQQQQTYPASLHAGGEPHQPYLYAWHQHQLAPRSSDTTEHRSPPLPSTSRAPWMTATATSTGGTSAATTSSALFRPAGTQLLEGYSPPLYPPYSPAYFSPSGAVSGAPPNSPSAPYFFPFSHHAYQPSSGPAAAAAATRAYLQMESYAAALATMGAPNPLPPARPTPMHFPASAPTTPATTVAGFALFPPPLPPLGAHHVTGGVSPRVSSVTATTTATVTASAVESPPGSPKYFAAPPPSRHHHSQHQQRRYQTGHDNSPAVQQHRMVVRPVRISPPPAPAPTAPVDEAVTPPPSVTVPAPVDVVVAVTAPTKTAEAGPSLTWCPPARPPKRLHRPPHFARGSFIQLAGGELRCVEDLRTEDFVRSAELSSDLQIDSSTVVRIEESPQPGVTAVLGFSVGDKKLQVTVEATLEHPFFVFGQGWSSCRPDRTRQCYSLSCHRLQVGDVCISLTHRETTSSSSSSGCKSDILSRRFVAATMASSLWRLQRGRPAPAATPRKRRWSASDAPALDVADSASATSEQRSNSLAESGSHARL